MKKIFIEKIKAYGFHGCLEEEKKSGQYFFVSLELELKSGFFNGDDDISGTVNYADACSLAETIVKQSRFDLIESLAEVIARALLSEFPGLSGVAVTVEKPGAPVEADFKTIGVTVSRKWHRVYLSLGSNLGDRETKITEAVEMIGASPECRVSRHSKIIETEPWGVTDQPPFLNCALEASTFLEPMELLRFLKNIENRLGREESPKWGPRAIDIDILLYDLLIYSSEELNIPHPYMHEREFVLTPLLEIAPHAVHPLLNRRIRELSPIGDCVKVSRT